MSFLKKINKQFPDQYINSAAGANLATIASVNNVVDESNAALDQVADKFIIPAGASSADLPPIMLKKTSTSFTYPDGTKLQGYAIYGSASLSGSSTYSIPQCTLTIPCVNITGDGEFEIEGETLCIGGFYMAYKTTGAVKCMVDAVLGDDPADAFEIVNDFSSGADMRKESDGTAVQSDYIGIFLTETETGGPGVNPSGIYTVTLQAQSGDGTPATAEVMYQFEFLVYSEVIPTIS